MPRKKEIKCACGKILGPNDPKIKTQEGVMCVDCWTAKMGKFVKKHPISD